MAFTFQCWHPCYSMFVRCFLTFFVSFFTGAETAFTSDDGWWACMGWRKEADGCIWLTVSYGFIQNVKGALYHGCMTCDTWHSYFWTRWVGATRLDKHFLAAKVPIYTPKVKCCSTFGFAYPTIAPHSKARNNRANYSKMGSSLSCAWVSPETTGPLTARWDRRCRTRGCQVLAEISRVFQQSSRRRPGQTGSHTLPA